MITCSAIITCLLVVERSLEINQNRSAGASTQHVMFFSPMLYGAAVQDIRVVMLGIDRTVIHMDAVF